MRESETGKIGIFENLKAKARRQLENPLMVTAAVAWLSLAGGAARAEARASEKFLRPARLEQVSDRELRRMSDPDVYRLLGQAAKDSSREQVVWKVDARWKKPDTRSGRESFEVDPSEYDQGHSIKEVHTHPAPDAIPSVGDLERDLILDVLYPGKFNCQVVDRSGNVWGTKFDISNEKIAAAMGFVEKCIPPDTRGGKRVTGTMKNLAAEREKDPHNGLDRWAVDGLCQEYATHDLASQTDRAKREAALADLRSRLGVEIELAGTISQ